MDDSADVPSEVKSSDLKEKPATFFDISDLLKLNDPSMAKKCKDLENSPQV